MRTNGAPCPETGADPWQAATARIGEHVRSLLRPGAGLDQSFFWRAIMREFGRNPLRRLLIGCEMAVIYPRPSNLAYARALVAQSSLLARDSERRLEDYVSFTRADFHPVDKLSCDWCSVCNGLLAWTGDLLDDALRSSRPLPAHWRFDGGHPFRRVFTAMRRVPLSAAKRHHDRAEVAAQIDDIRQRAERRLRGEALDSFMRAAGRFVLVRHTATCFERRYCPFRHLRALAYAADHWGYDWHVPEQLQAAARVLAATGDVDCHRCADALAASALPPAQDAPSVMQEYFELLCRTSIGADPAPAVQTAPGAASACAR